MKRIKLASNGYRRLDVRDAEISRIGWSFTVESIDWELEFYEFKTNSNSRIFTNFTVPQNLKNKFAVMSYNMKSEDFLDLQTYKQN